MALVRAAARVGVDGALDLGDALEVDADGGDHAGVVEHEALRVLVVGEAVVGAVAQLVVAKVEVALVAVVARARRVPAAVGDRLDVGVRAPAGTQAVGDEGVVLGGAVRPLRAPRALVLVRALGAVVDHPVVERHAVGERLAVGVLVVAGGLHVPLVLAGGEVDAVLLVRGHAGLVAAAAVGVEARVVAALAVGLEDVAGAVDHLAVDAAALGPCAGLPGARHPVGRLGAAALADLRVGVVGVNVVLGADRRVLGDGVAVADGRADVVEVLVGIALEELRADVHVGRRRAALLDLRGV